MVLRYLNFGFLLSMYRKVYHISCCDEPLAAHRIVPSHLIHRSNPGYQHHLLTSWYCALLTMLCDATSRAVST